MQFFEVLVQLLFFQLPLADGTPDNGVRVDAVLGVHLPVPLFLAPGLHVLGANLAKDVLDAVVGGHVGVQGSGGVLFEGKHLHADWATHLTEKEVTVLLAEVVGHHVP